MEETQTICLLNDSFPPLIDGVANTVLNYADQLHQTDYRSMVITPANPNADDERFSYPVLRYAIECGISHKCIFTGAIHDREKLRESRD